MRSEALQNVKRRLITIPVAVLVCAGMWLLLPVWSLIALVVDLVRPSRWGFLRSTWMLAIYLGCEIIGLVVALFLSPLGRISKARSIRAHFRLQLWWARTLYGAFSKLFGLHTEVTGAEVFQVAGPVIVFARHVSQVDSLLPAVFISQPYGLLLRYVLKSELLASPAMDIVGHRLKNHFVRRTSLAGHQEIQRVAQLGQGLSPNEGVLIFPEGTRFSESARQRLLRQMVKHADPALYAIAQNYRRVLPPRLGGPLALLQSGADAVFMAHTGFEGLRTTRDVFSGRLVGRHIRIHFWRVPHAQIPSGDDARSLWLYDQWKRLDDWVQAQGTGA